ncbi:uncharacterized protein LOC143574094 [Bidens hawaiensis]|uniref:uncharacterized protein LOC143574094 n=1 Tax=Bidens hawaiensis TaxID=980011 RepID=UPI004049A7FB
MAFGSQSQSQRTVDESETHVSETQRTYIGVGDDGVVHSSTAASGRVEKTGVEIANFLNGAIETIGPSNVLSVVTDNAANCKAAEKEIEKALATVSVLNSWRELMKSGDENGRTSEGNVPKTINDDLFWEDVENILAITKPVYLLIKFCDGEGPRMGEIYEKMDNMVGEIKDIMMENKFLSYFPEINKIVVARWNKMTIHLHCLGFALSPKFYDKYYLEKLAPGGERRTTPNNDKEVTLGVMEAFKRISENEAERQVLQQLFATFHMKKELYSRAATQADVVIMDAIDWWATYGSETPELAEEAKKVFSQPISSSSAESNWSTYSYIHSVKRNRLNSKRADNLLFIHSNIRLQSCFTESYKSGPHKKWDMNPENAYIEGSSARLEEMMWDDLDDEGVENGRGKRKRQDYNFIVLNVFLIMF